MTNITASKSELAQKIANDFVTQLDEWYSLSESWDSELDTQIHRWYSDAPNVFPKRPYFSPSAADACPRELYYKQKRYPKDSFRKQPHQGRWVEIGTHVGDIIQRTVLAMERNLEDKVGVAPKFRFERTDKGEPMFEEFSKRNVRVEHKGKAFNLFGATDGIMTYRSDDGETIRVGLEVKSKQTTSARTSLYSMRDPEAKHVRQCAMYGEMFDVDYFVIIYVNTSHKGWTITDEDYKKTPDIRAFGIYITEEMKAESFDKFVGVLEAVANNEPPTLDLNKWTFNGFKTAIAKEMPKEEFEKLQDYARRVAHSSLPPFEIANVKRVADTIRELREAE